MKRRSFLASVVAGLVAPFLPKGDAQPEVLENVVEETESDNVFYFPDSNVDSIFTLPNPSGYEFKAEIVQECKNTRRVPLAYVIDHEDRMSLSYDLCDWYRCDKEDYWYERGKEVLHV